ncbi:hypothetical protein [Virgibacillus proomii]|uniref:hypothetical protein n=1 Tax=Virgibacillus proomii TaxID=84407 RepID=UPI001C103102|nr:hypothetical protein [Virgibacillus proomii]MBU5267080.1 hypothetical protein [Virgibacillus proomii]
MGIILSKSEKEDLEELGNVRISTVKKINKKEYYVESYFEKNSLLHNESLIEVFISFRRNKQLFVSGN